MARTILRVCKRFEWKGIPLQIAECEETYLNSQETIKIKRIIAPNGAGIEPGDGYRDTLKEIVRKTLEYLDRIEKRAGFDLMVQEMTKPIP